MDLFSRLLKEVLWRFERFGADDANWHFRMLYQMRWGEHLRSLAYYLYWRLQEEYTEVAD
jgi:hypothetical protein